MKMKYENNGKSHECCPSQYTTFDTQRDFIGFFKFSLFFALPYIYLFILRIAPPQDPLFSNSGEAIVANLLALSGFTSNFEPAKMNVNLNVF